MKKTKPRALTSFKSTIRTAGAFCVNIDLHPDGPVDPAFNARVVGDAQDVLTEWAA